ncbi:hydroxysqualene dehydroxylase [Candidatus Laterigemmans baculatus]|uniref:hydroxysqualene dehydroxylase n=1 Tax=Candidatus Laterigemmans baculatus TaxID=2770505 RepID=UPI0013D9D74D|nr:FAD-dependent oxidoreductase [Candidatus Laterigemmans baculatus]
MAIKMPAEGARRVAIAGGGLAGLTCAKYLVDAGLQVTVVESLPFLGGRASTYRDQDGEWVEQGLHIFLGVYSEFMTLLNEIGQFADDILFWMDDVHYQDRDGHHATYGLNPIHAPLKTLFRALSQNDYLGILDKLSIVPLAAPAFASLEAIQKNYDGLTVTEWWRKAGGREDVMQRVLRPLCRGLQFTDPDQFSAYDFLGWAHNAIYGIRNIRLGGYEGARDDLIFAPLGRYLTDRGATIRTGTPLRAIHCDAAGGRVEGFELDHGERVEADAYVVAVPPWIFAPLMPSALREQTFFAEIANLPVAPAISVQIWFDRAVTGGPGFYLVARTHAPVYQEQSPHTYPVARGSRISVIVSPADELLDLEDDALVRMVVESIGSVNQVVADAVVTKSVVLKHRQHLVRPLPGAMSARPQQRTPVPNLFLAGDWTQQEFFGSQEGAVRGGKYCAREVRCALLPDLPRSRV